MAAPLLQFPGGQAPEPEPVNPADIVASPANPLAVVRALLHERTDGDGHLLLRKWNGDYYTYVGPHWVDTDPESIRQWYYERLEHAIYETGKEDDDGNPETKMWSPDKGKVDKLVDAMVTPCLLPRDMEIPSWLSTRRSALGFVPCRNGLVDIATQAVLPCTPNYFGTTCIPVDFDPNAPEPVEWMKFLRTLWEPVKLTADTPEDERDLSIWNQDADGSYWRDADEIRTLRQWFGYILSGRLDLQKILLLKGPPRCGKGTIARTLTALVGKANTDASTLSGIATNFGLEGAIGKTLMVVGDARLGSQGQETVIERLLSISGQDMLTLDRKNRQSWAGTLQTRVMILSNDTPKFLDASGAIASRFVILEFEKEFLGREDTTLGEKLQGELAGILRWALDGLADLSAAGRLTEPASHTAAMKEFYDLVSPIGTFAREACEPDPNAIIPFADLYRQYVAWAEEAHRGVTSQPRFSADLKSAKPGVKTDHRPRDASGKKLGRHVKGLRFNKEWLERMEAQTGQPAWKMR